MADRWKRIKQKDGSVLLIEKKPIREEIEARLAYFLMTKVYRRRIEKNIKEWEEQNIEQRRLKRLKLLMGRR